MRLKLKIVTTFNEKNIIIVCSEMRFSKTSYHIETSQLASVTINQNQSALQLTGFSISYEFLGKGITEQTLKLLLYFLSNLAIHQSWM